jgi:hypothetical protein
MIKSRQRKLADGSGPFYEPILTLLLIPPTRVGGYFKSTLRSDLNDPPTSVGGIQISLNSSYRKDLNHPPTAVGGISGKAAPFTILNKFLPALNTRLIDLA